MSNECLDPELFLPPIVTELILQHLSVAEALTASLVSTSWYSLIALSPTCMKRTNLIINGRKYFLNHREEEVRTHLDELSASLRRYEKFTLYAQRPRYLAKNVIKFLQCKRNSLKNVKIWSEKFSDESEIEDLLESIEKVENLDLRNISLASELNFNEIRQFEFRNLKKLALSNLKPFLLFGKSFSGLEKLESLKIENGCVESVLHLVRSSRNLKKLSVIGFKLEDELFVELSKIQSLSIRKLKIKSHNTIGSERLANFMESQSANITKLILDIIGTTEMHKAAMKLPRLEILHLLTLPEEPILLQERPTITKFQIYSHAESEVILNFIDAMPNLKNLKLTVCSQNLETMIRKKLTKLETFGFHKKD